VAPAIVWQDRRTADRCLALRRAGKEPAISRRTGLKLDPYFSATKLEWILRNVPGVRARARRGALAFGTVDSWLLWKLTDGVVHATDATNASRTLLYDIGRRRWDPGLLRLFGVPRSLLPEVRHSAADFGRTRGVPGLPDGIPIRGVAGDQQAALFGQGCASAGGLKNTYGTGCFLLLHTGSKQVPPGGGLLTTIACGPRGEPAYALEGACSSRAPPSSGCATGWASSIPPRRARPSPAGQRQRRHDPRAGVRGARRSLLEARGARRLVRPHARVTRAHLVRATLESIAYQSRDLVEAMRLESGVRVRELRVDGGASLNGFLMQFQADLLGIPIVRPGLVETTALGAALLAGIGAGWWKRASDLQAVRGSGKVFRPKMRRAERERLYRGWTEAVGTLLSAGGS